MRGLPISGPCSAAALSPCSIDAQRTQMAPQAALNRQKYPGRFVQPQGITKMPGMRRRACRGRGRAGASQRSASAGANGSITALRGRWWRSERPLRPLRQTPYVRLQQAWGRIKKRYAESANCLKSIKASGIYSACSQRVRGRGGAVPQVGEMARIAGAGGGHMEGQSQRGWVYLRPSGFAAYISQAASEL